MNIKVRDILKICNAKLVFGDSETICEDFSKDTRTIKKDDVYVGIKGEKFDGNLFYEDAFQKGAKVCILQGLDIPNTIKEKYSDRCLILVEDTIKALQEIASYKRDLYDIPVIAVTGSVGKTSTKDMIASVVGTSYNVLKTQGNLNNHIGLPLTILELKNQNALVVEMGMNNIGEISLLSKIAKPSISVITNVGTAHIGNLGSRENILKAKLEIIDGLKDNGTLIINNDNDLLNKWNENKKNINVFTYGIENKSDVMAQDIELNENGSIFIASYNSNDSSEKISVPVSGLHFVYNALCAIAVGKQLGISSENIKKGIEEFELSKNRMEIIKKNGITVINDCYNANYDSMKAAIEIINRMKGNRKIAILGDMLELGDYSKELHSKVGEEVAKNNIDILITVGEEAKNIVKSAQTSGLSQEKTSAFNKNEDAINFIKHIIKKGDIILVKASNAMKFIEIVQAIIA